MNKKLSITFIVMIFLFLLIDPLKHLGIIPLTNLEREEEFFKTFQLDDCIVREYNILTVIGDKVDRSITGEEAIKKSQELISYFSTLEIRDWKGSFKESEDFSTYFITMINYDNHDSMMIDIRGNKCINVIVGVPFEGKRDYHDWNYLVLDGIDMEHIENFINSLSKEQ